MTRSLRAVLTLFAALGLAGIAPTARADCPPNAGYCADVSVGGGAELSPSTRGAQVIITVGPMRRPPPPQIVVVRPPPPPQVVYVRPPPPPPPQPQVVYVRPQQQVVYVQQQQQPQYTYQRASVSRNVSGTTGLRFFFAGASGGNARLGGMGAALRLRPTEHFAVDLGVGVYGGTDHAGRDRVEIPVTADVLAFVNPQHRAQFYGVAGLGMSFAYGNVGSTDIMERNYTYVGGNLGAGIEFRITRGFALNMDLRGVLRKQTGGAAEFTRTTSTGTETTRTSAGVVGQLGATLYF